MSVNFAVCPDCGEEYCIDLGDDGPLIRPKHDCKKVAKSDDTAEHIVMARDSKKSRFVAFNPEEREAMRIVMQAHINTIGEVCALCDPQGIYVGRYYTIFEDLMQEIEQA